MSVDQASYEAGYNQGKRDALADLACNEADYQAGFADGYRQAESDYEDTQQAVDASYNSGYRDAAAQLAPTLTPAQVESKRLIVEAQREGRDLNAMLEERIFFGDESLEVDGDSYTGVEGE